MTTSHEKNADLIASLRAGPACPGCAENLSPAQWWVDLALRLEKAVHCMGSNSRANPHLQGVIETFESSATEAHDIAALLAKLPRDRARREVQRSDSEPGEEPGRTFSEYDKGVHRRLLRGLHK